MKIRELLNEGCTDRVNYYYGDFNHDEIDRRFNPDAYNFIKQQKEETPEEITIYTHEENDNPKWSNTPEKNSRAQSPGYRGKKYTDKILRR